MAAPDKPNNAIRSEPKYWAFISYSHLDRRWGDWLHRALETYKVPQRLVGMEGRDEKVPRRIFPVFRDREELPTSSDLADNIVAALNESRFLVVICSPNSARSSWVAEEVLTFKRLGRENRILPLVIAGEPNATDGKPGISIDQEAFPRPLRYKADATGELTAERTEPIAADARPGGDGRANAKLKLVAGILGLPYDLLRQRELSRKIRRLQLVSLAAVLMIGIFAAITAYALWQKSVVRQQLRQASQRHYATGQDLLRAGEWRRGITYFGGSLEAWPENRRTAGHLLSAIVFAGSDSDQLPYFGVYHRARTYGAAFSPDGKYFVTASDDHTARVCDTTTGAVIHELSHDAALCTAQFDPTGNKIASSTQDGFVYIWEARSGSLLHRIRAADPKRDRPLVESVVFSPNGRTILSGAWDHTARIFDADTGAEIATLPHGGRVACAGFDPSGSRVLVGGWDGIAQVWDAVTNQRVGAPMAHRATIRRAVFSGDGSKVITSSMDKTARIWDANTGRPTSDPLQHNDMVWSVAASLDGKYAATASIDRTARIWRLSDGAPVGSPKMHDAGVETATFSPDSKLIVTASRDNTVRVWDVESGKPVGQSKRHDDFALYAIFSPDGSRVLSTGKDGAAYIWSMALPARPGQILPIDEEVRMVHATANSDELHVALASGEVDVWSISRHEFLGPRRSHGSEPSTVAWVRDGSLFATAGTSSPIRIWNREGGLVAETEVQDGRIRALAFAPSGNILLSSSDRPNAQGAVRFWRVADGKFAAPQWDHPRPCFAIAASSSGLFAAGGQDSQIHFRNEKGQPAREPIIVEDSVLSLSFHPKNSILLSGAIDHTARIWSLESSREMAPHMLLKGGVTSTGFSADGRRLFFASAADENVYCHDSDDLTLAVEPLRHPFGIINVSSNPDASQVFTVARNGLVRRWKLPEGRVPPPNSLEDYLKSLTGWGFSKSEKITRVSMPERLRLRENIMTSTHDESLWSRVMIWSLADSTKDVRTPWSE